jgi:hypothetical protein
MATGEAAEHSSIDPSEETALRVLRAADPAAHLAARPVQMLDLGAYERRSSRRRRSLVTTVALAAAAVPVVAGFLILLPRIGGSQETAVTSPAPTGARGGAALTSFLRPGESLIVGQDFVPAVDGFSFPNFAGAPERDRFDATMMAALFSKESVCADPSAGQCTMLPAARKVARQLEMAIATGRCEGMAVLAQRYFDGSESRPRNFADTAALSQSDVERMIGFWWATQVSPTAARASATYRSLEPSQLVTALEQGIEEGKGYTLGMYSGQSGHSVTPIAVLSEGPNKVILIYDADFPEEFGRIEVDLSRESWFYDRNAANSSGTAVTWSGIGPGSLDLTPMDARQTPFEVSFGGTRGVKSLSYFVLITRDGDEDAPVGLKIRTRLDGADVEIDSLNPRQMASAPFEIRNLVSEVNGISGVLALVPVALGASGALELEVSGNQGVGNMAMSVLRTGAAAVAVDSASSFAVNLTAKAFSTEATVVFADASRPGTVMVANGDRAAEITVSDGLSVSFSSRFSDDDAAPDKGARRIETPLPDFEVRDSADRVVFSGRVTSGGGAEIERIVYDRDSGGFNVSTERLESEEMDEDFVKDPTGRKAEENRELGLIDVAAPPAPVVIDTAEVDPIEEPVAEPATAIAPAPPVVEPVPEPVPPPPPPPAAVEPPTEEEDGEEEVQPPVVVVVLPPPPIPVTISASSGSKWELQDDPSFTAEVTNSALTGTRFLEGCVVTRASGEAVGNYTVTISVGTCRIMSGSSNVTSQYAITLLDGSFEILEREKIIFQASSGSKWLDDDDPAHTADLVVGESGELKDGHHAVCTPGRELGEHSAVYAVTISAETCRIMSGDAENLDPVDVTHEYEITMRDGEFMIMRGENASQPAWKGKNGQEGDKNNQPDSWGAECAKTETYSDGTKLGLHWISPDDYSLVVIKSANIDYVYRDVVTGEVLMVSAEKGISHIIFCTGDDVSYTGAAEEDDSAPVDDSQDHLPEDGNVVSPPAPESEDSGESEGSDDIKNPEENQGDQEEGASEPVDEMPKPPAPPTFSTRTSGNRDRWTATIEVDGAIAGTVITGDWNTGVSGSCTVQSNGKCTITLSGLSEGLVVTWTWKPEDPYTEEQSITVELAR